MEIYIHIPFCVRKCKYCGFYSIAGHADLFDDYVAALCLEIERRAVDDSIDTIYIGGGTPTILNVKHIARIVDALNANFDLTSLIEFTVEANPGTIDRNYIAALRTIGVNRLSIGVQSFDDRLLKIIGRIHTAADALKIVDDARSIFDNVSVDLIYSLPHQTLDDVKRSINIVKTLDVQHVSIYGLEVEEGTEFERLQRKDKLPLPSDDEDSDMYDFITTELPRIGFDRYEISNYARSGFESRHNLGYWSDAKYIGLGAGAHSYDRSERRFNPDDVVEYINGTMNGRDVSQIEEIVTRKIAMEEFCFLGLRKTSGISITQFKRKFNASIDEIFIGVVDRLTHEGLIETVNDRIRMTPRGMKIGNVVFMKFLLD